MKKTTIITKVFIWFIMGACLLANIHPVFAGTEGPVTSSFSTTVSPVTNGISVFEAGTSIPVAGFTPQHSYDIKISITDNDGLGDLKRVHVKLWYDNYGNNVGEAQFNSLMYPESSSYEEIIWTRSNNAIYSSSQSDSTWQFPSSVLPTNSFLADNKNTSFDFVFTVNPGKVSTETTGDARWHVAVLTTDTANYANFKAYTDKGVPGLFMNWYGEVYADPVTVEWGSVPLGMNFEDDPARQTLGVGKGVNYISNGFFTAGIKASTTWSTTQGSSLTLASTTAKENTFSLKASLFTIPNPKIQGVLLRADGNVVALDESFSLTSESGDFFDENQLFLALANKIDYPGEYTGIIYYTIHN